MEKHKKAQMTMYENTDALKRLKHNISSLLAWP